MEPKSRIYVAGHNGLVGSAIVRALTRAGYTEIITVPRSDVDLRDPTMVKWMFSTYLPDYVFLAAAKVGGIKAHLKDPVGFLSDNLAIQQNVLLNAADYVVKKLVFLGSNCIYPKDCSIPIKEEYLMAGALEPSNEGYAIAKIAGIKLCQSLRRQLGCNFVSAMPCNIFGPHDRLDPENSHIVPGMMVRMHKAKIEGASSFKVWGDGTAYREILFSDDLATDLITIMRSYDDEEPINVGGTELPVMDIARAIASVVGLTCPLKFDPEQPTGCRRKPLDGTKMNKLGYIHHALKDALRITYEDVVERLT